MSNNLPTLSNEGGLSAYLEQIKKFPMLAAEEEYMLAKNWKTTGNIKAAEKLVTSHLRLVAKIAMGYKGYGLPINEMISEGNVGLMQAVKKFEPEKGFRLATYAMWWIKASIQEYILRSWSLVKIGTTTAQKKLFFNLKKLKNQIAPRSEGDLRKEHVTEIASKLDVNEDEINNPVDIDLVVSSFKEDTPIEHNNDISVNKNMLILDFVSECWIELYMNEKLVVAQNFEKDDQFIKEIAMPFKIIIENADSVTGTYNDERIDFITNANRLTRLNTIYFLNEQLD